MLNYVWLGLVAIAVIVAGINGQITSVTNAAFDYAKTAVDIALGLIGIMALWLGIMRIAEEAGMVRILARAVKPIARRLFPDVPPDHPAMGAMVLNIAANWLGLGNAATPLGLKAMEELQKLNPQKDTATNAMVMFLALNTASITLIPATIIAIRTQLGSHNPAEIIGTTIFSSTCATIAAVTAAKLFEYAQLGGKAFRSHLLNLLKGLLVLGLVAVALLGLGKLGVLHFLFGWLTMDLFKSVVSFVSDWAVPFLLFAIPVLAFSKRIHVYEVFIEGAKEGFEIAVKIIPFLVAILVAIGMFRASGAMDLFVKLVSPVTDLIGMPAEVLPAALMRPLSGSGTLGIVTELMKTHGPDSFIGRLASTMYGSTETTFYVIAVYFGSVQIKKTRHAVPAGLVGDTVGLLAALFICKVMFGG
ncbi:MAG: spore maturation protein [Calditrichaeota bacterium]|nr:spore maturation protein [Calditrichota bacterium]